MSMFYKDCIWRVISILIQLFFLIIILYCFEYDIGYFKGIIDNYVFTTTYSPSNEYVVVNSEEFRRNLLIPKIHGYCKIVENNLNGIKYLCM